MAGLIERLQLEGLDPRQAELARYGNIGSSHYEIFDIPKASGGTRAIMAPIGDAKAIQEACLRILESLRLAGSDAAHAYYHGRSIRTMAYPHVNRKWLVKIDIKDFFPSIRVSRVADLIYSDLRSGGSSSRESRSLASPLSYVIKRWCGDLQSPYAGLPMGAPTSPFLSNFYAGKLLDKRMIGLCRTFDIRGRLARPGFIRNQPIYYTRYADDLCFSSDYKHLPAIVPYVTNMINAAGLRVNPDKVKIIKNTSRQVVCGVSVNEVIGKPKNYRKGLKMELHRIAINMATGRCEPGMQFTHGSIENKKPIDLLKLSGAVEHVRFLSENQAAPLIRLLNIIKDMHGPEQGWSVTTREWVERRRNGSQPSAIQHS